MCDRRVVALQLKILEDHWIKRTRNKENRPPIFDAATTTGEETGLTIEGRRRQFDLD